VDWLLSNPVFRRLSDQFGGAEKMKSAINLGIASGLCLITSAAFGGSGPLIINEYLYDPPIGATGDANQDGVFNTSQDEFVELVNTSAGALDISGWTIRDGAGGVGGTIRHTFPDGTVLESGCAIVVFGGGSPFAFGFNGAIVQTASTGQLALNNDGDLITIRDGSGVQSDQVSYPNAGDVNVSYTLDPDVTGTAFVKHSEAAGSGGTLFSPGSTVDGSAIGGCASFGPDTDGDGVPDAYDNCPDVPNLNQADCNGNGVGDACEFLKFDCNNNGIPDECEPDCNGSGLPDDCDVIFKISADCNNNLIPDECEPDCNGNGFPDECDIEDGFSTDANGNGIPDECESAYDVVINEILADPPSSGGDANNDQIVNTTQDEFVELINNSASSVNISGWTISDASGGGTIRHTFPTGTVLQSQCGIVVFGGGSPTGQVGGMQSQVASTGTLSLNNAGDTVTLLDAKGLLVDDHAYGVEGGQDTSLTRSPDVTGDFVLHNSIMGAAAFSAGKKVNGTTFSGCPAQPDDDADGIPNAVDNCPNTPNALQQDCDRDGVGDACETDIDGNGNGIPDNCEVGVPGNVKLSEIRVDQPGTDNDEYFEIKGPAGLSLNGLTLIVLGDNTAAQGSGVIEAVVSLNGHSIPSDGRFLCVEPTNTLAPVSQKDFITGANGLNFENSDNVTYVLVTNFTGSINLDLDANNNGILGESGTDPALPWSAVVDAVGLIVQPNPPTSTEYAYGAALGGVDVGPDGIFVPGQVYRCETAGLWTIGKFDPFDAAGGTDTPGVANLICIGLPCPGDRNNNGVVDVDDLLIVINTWGTADPAGDATGNGIVDVDDLLVVINDWGTCD
jgi:hypothetical protein